MASTTAPAERTARARESALKEVDERLRALSERAPLSDEDKEVADALLEQRLRLTKG